MMRIRLIQSRFRGVYIGLVALWGAACLALNIVISVWVSPSLTLARVQSVESLIRSHEKALVYNDHRSLRDELLRRGILADDRNFEELRPGRKEDSAIVQQLRSTSRAISPYAYLGPSLVLFFGGAGTQSADLANFVVVLRTDYFESLSGLLLWRILGCIGIGVLLGVVGYAIRRQEKFLLGKIGLLTASLSEVDGLFADEGIAKNEGASKLNDEFTLASHSLVAAGQLLKDKTRQIEAYKREFERKTRLEQLAQTICYTSHELKAPLQEGAQFLGDLPDFIDTMPREKLFNSIRSLQTRLSEGAESLQAALNRTRDANHKPEAILVGAFLEEFTRKIQEHPSLKDSRIQLQVDSSLAGCRVQMRRAEVESAFWNLVRNSSEAKRDCIIAISAKPKESNVIIGVRDNGPGIPDTLLERVFEDCFTTKSNGSGLGLSIVHKGITRSGGRIQALSCHQGAHFEVCFPIVLTKDPKAVTNTGACYA